MGQLFGYNPFLQHGYTCPHLHEYCPAMIISQRFLVYFTIPYHHMRNNNPTITGLNIRLSKQCKELGFIKKPMHSSSIIIKFSPHPNSTPPQIFRATFNDTKQATNPNSTPPQIFRATFNDTKRQQTQTQVNLCL